MDDEALGAKLQELTLSDPSLGYRAAVHAELKKDPKFASIGLKKVLPADGILPGILVRLEGLKARPELNGLFGRAIKFDEKKERWQVCLVEHGDNMLLKVENLVPLCPDEYEEVQLALQSLRADQSQICGSTPAKSGVCLSERDFVSEPPSDADIIGGFTKSEIEQRLSSGNYSEIVQERLKLVDIPGKGKGYVAAKQIKQGEVLLIDIAMCSSPEDSSGDASQYTQMARQIQSKMQVSKLVPTVNSSCFDEVLSLAVAPGKSHGDMIAILENNVFQCLRQSDYCALFVGASRFNHSCCPRAVNDCDRSQAVIRALVDIPEGVEVCISYVPPGSNYQDRQEKLSGKGFRCRCERCVEESIVDPQLLVPCKCGKFKFSVAGDVPRQQSCSACQCQFERSAAMANLRSLEAANEFMWTHSAAQADPRELVKKLNPVVELATVGRVNGAPPNHLQSLQLLNNLANCHYFVATRIPGPHRKTSLGAFFDIKERFMTAYEANHGKTMQRDTNYVQSLHRVIMGDFSDKDKKKMWERKLVETCVWHFGQRNIPVGVTTAVHS